MARHIPIKLEQQEFRLHVKQVNGKVWIEPMLRPTLVGKDRNEIRKYFRDVIKYFNSTIRKNEVPRLFIKVEQRFKVIYKSGTVYKYIKV